MTAQAVSSQIKDVVMPAPNASSLGKYGDIPVGYYSGIPNIGVPIYTASQGPLSVPIALNYHAGGLKVGETSSWVGLGWSLQAGGMISRTVQGKADEHAFGYMAIGQTLKIENGCIGTVGTTNDQTINPNIASGFKDGEPDIFSFAVGGYSGKFYIDKRGTNTSDTSKGRVVLIPTQDVKIDYDLSSPTANSDPYRLKKFTMTTPDGTIYEFGDLGLGTTERAIEITENNDNLFWIASTWYLKKVTSFDKSNSITLSYVPETYRYFYRMSGHNSFRADGTLNVDATYYNFASAVPGYSLNAVDVQGCRLSSIQTQTETISFVADTIRGDLKFGSVASTTQLGTNTIAGTEPKMLDKIKIQTGTFCKEFNLVHSYFEDKKVGHLSGQADGDKRLKLEYIQERSCSGTPTTVPAHIFTYYGKSGDLTYLPNRFSSAIDHWGYYNDATTNPKSGLNIPPTTLTYIVGTSPQTINEGTSNRETNETAMKWGTMESITYPTGGQTTFDYEANSYCHVEEDHAPMSITKSFPGVNCSVEPVSTSSLVNITRQFTANELANTMYYKLERVGQTFITGSPCGSNPGYVEISVSQDGVQIPSGLVIKTVSLNSVPVTERLKLNTLFTNLQPNIYYTFSIRVVYAGAKFTLEKDAGQPIVAYNRKVGGLRIKTITTTDGAAVNPPIVKTYNYDAENTTAGKSSGVLYNKPQYSYVYRGFVGYCNTGVPATLLTTHFLMDQSIVPLSSFEGSHIGYLAVREYAGTGNGYTLYQYNNTESEPSINIPFPYQQPRIEAGSLASKKQKLTNGTDVAYETNAYKVETDEPSAGNCIKFTTYSADPGVSTPKYSFWKNYNIKTKPLRLSQTVSVVDGVSTTVDYTYAAGLLPKRSETVTNSNGATTTSTYYYATDDLTNYTPLKDRNMIGFPVKVKQQTGTATKWSRVRYKVFGTAQLEPEFLDECFETIPTNWITRLQIAAYTTSGMPTTVYKNNFLVPEIYTWDPTYQTLLRKKEFGTGTNKLTWAINYAAGTSLVEKMTDENGLDRKYTYDPLMRLQIIQDRMKVDGTDVQATTKYIYHYKGQPIVNELGDVNDVNDGNMNFVRVKNTFKGVTAPLSTKQYLDGLGRSMEVVKELYTAPSDVHPTDYWHQKNYVSFDALGRQNKAYLPFEKAAFGFETSSNFVNPTAYTETTFEFSPLSRPTNRKNTDGTFTYLAYGTNTVADGVRIFTKSTASGEVESAASSGVYAANTLYKTTATDENGKLTCIFKDKLGRLILTRKFLNGSIGQNVDTYNVYDDYNQLVVVLPPGSVVVGSTVSIENNLTFQYKYDSRNRLIEKKIPGTKSQKFYYDNRDMLMLTQDGNMRATAFGGAADKYLGTQYDEIGRVVRTGLVTSSDPVASANNGVTIPDGDNKLTETKFYDNRTWVKHQGAKVLKESTIVTPTNFVWSYVERRDGIEYTGNPVWMGKQHLRYSGVSQNPILDSDTYGVDWVVSGYNGLQQPDLTIRYLFEDPNRAGEVRTWQNFTYDNARRLTDVKYDFGTGGAGISSPTYSPSLSNINYDFKDQVIEKNIRFTGSSALQSIDYAYNLRGWLTNINNVALNTGTTMSIMTPNMTGSGTIQNLAITPYINKAVRETMNTYQTAHNNEVAPILSDGSNVDLFSENITYGSPAAQTGALSQLNGNISSTTWQVLGKDKQAYGFTYDGLDRLTDAKYFDITGTAANSIYSTDNKFGETVTYDARGNITSLQRNGLNTGTWTSNGYTAATYGIIDNLVYNYKPNPTPNDLITVTSNTTSNVLLNVKDFSLTDKGFKYVSANPAPTYTYDDNGNLTADANKKITKITYNYLNLPSVITFVISAVYSGKIEFVYDATGAKQKKIVTEIRENVPIDERILVTIYDYINGAEYKAGVLQRFTHTEGSVVRQPSGAYIHEYSLRDHLGNTRVTFTDADNNGFVDASDIKQINHYYPFGLNMEGNWQGGAQGDNKNQYNDKEWNDDFGLGWNDYGARWYDPALGRWNSVDPLAEMYGSMSSYHYGMNNPIRYIDPTGMASEAYSFGMKSGQKNSDDKSTTIATTVVNDDTKETYTVDDGYDFTFNVSDKEFKEIKEKKGFVFTSSYLRWAMEATAYKIAKAMQLGLKTGKKVVFDTAEGVDDEIFDNAGEDAMNGDYSKAAMMLLLSKAKIPGLKLSDNKLIQHAFQWSIGQKGKALTALELGLMRKLATYLYRNASVIRKGTWGNPAAGGYTDALFFSNGKHIVVTQADGTMITILRNAMGNGHFDKAVTIFQR